jgi:hypothetical protein
MNSIFNALPQIVRSQKQHIIRTQSRPPLNPSAHFSLKRNVVQKAHLPTPMQKNRFPNMNKNTAATFVFLTWNRNLEPKMLNFYTAQYHYVHAYGGGHHKKGGLL